MEPLTNAELRALHALARHEYATDAAKSLGVTPQTLRNQVWRAYKKLGVTGQKEAFRRIGWLRPPRFMPTNEDITDYTGDESPPSKGDGGAFDPLDEEIDYHSLADHKEVAMIAAFRAERLGRLNR